MNASDLIESVYAAIPSAECKGLCQRACGPIGCSDAEAARLQENGIALPTTRHHHKEGSLTCSHLSEDGRCSIYAMRPLICRLYGVIETLKCPHGCKPKGGFMKDATARILSQSLDAITGKAAYLP